MFYTTGDTFWYTMTKSIARLLFGTILAQFHSLLAMAHDKANTIMTNII